MLELVDVHKKFNLQAGFFAQVGRYVYAVNGVSFQVRDNTIYGLVGESGCGKTTVARLIVRMYNPDRGNIRFTDSSGTPFSSSGLTRAELRLLRKLEADVHEKTKEIHRAVEKNGGVPNFFQKKMIARLAHRQARLSEMAEKLREALRR